MLLAEVFVVLALVASSRAEYKWTGTEWVFVEPNREEFPIEGSGNYDDEDYNYNDYDYGGGTAKDKITPSSGGDKLSGGGSNFNTWDTSSSKIQQHGGLDSSKFNFVRPGISDDEDFYEGSGSDSGIVGGGTGGSNFNVGDSKFPLFDTEGSGGDSWDITGDTEGPRYPSPTSTTTTTTSQSPPINIEDTFGNNFNFGVGRGKAPEDSNRPLWPSSVGDDELGPTHNIEDDEYDYTVNLPDSDIDDYPPFDDDVIGHDNTGIIIDDSKPQVPFEPAGGSTTPAMPFYPPVETTSSTEKPLVRKDPPIVTDVPTNRPVSFFAQPGILAAVIGGAVVGLLCAILLVMFIVYRMRKKDEGSYILDEPKRVHNGNVYKKTPNREIYA